MNIISKKFIKVIIYFVFIIFTINFNAQSYCEWQTGDLEKVEDCVNTLRNEYDDMLKVGKSTDNKKLQDVYTNLSDLYDELIQYYKQRSTRDIDKSKEFLEKKESLIQSKI